MVYNGYPCRNSEVCIPLGWLCDNQKDCLGKEIIRIVLYKTLIY